MENKNNKETLSIPTDAFSLKERKRPPIKSNLDISYTIR